MSKFDRRKFLKTTSLSAAGIATAAALNSCAEEELHQERPIGSQYMGDFQAPKLNQIRLALIGVGARGSGHATDFASLEGVEIVAISDLYEDWAQRSADNCKEIGNGNRHQNIKLYHGDENLWKQMLVDEKPDTVIISTNWKNHAPMAIEAMKQGAHAFVEVPIAMTLEEMWAIVDTSEATGKHCMMMENVNYGRDELMFLNMCRQGLIGDILHGEASYIHELRFQMEEQERGTGSWRTHHYANRNGNLYPTHGLGPVAQYMNLGRTDDTFSTLVSYSTPALGRQLYAGQNYDPDHKWNQLDYKGGDLNTSIIKTQMGRTVMVQWDETSPRPYSRLNLIQGTLGALAGFPTRVALQGGVEGFTDSHHSWAQGKEALAALREKYDHPLYKKLNESTKNSGHGGMDGIMRYRIAECLRNGWALDQNVYEGCFWSAVSPLSEKSVAKGGMPQQFPDFTRGEWQKTKVLEIVS